MRGRRLSLRPTRDCDLATVLDLHRAAFGPEAGPVIADLAAALLADPTAKPYLSLLAERAGEALGHILFTPATLSPDPGGLTARLLSPLAVRPDAQRSGVGGVLIRAGLARLRQAGVDLVFVLGSPGYYPRFGFHPCRAVAAPYPIPREHAEAWMAQALTPGALDRVQGAVLRCAAALDRSEYWGNDPLRRGWSREDLHQQQRRPSQAKPLARNKPERRRASAGPSPRSGALPTSARRSDFVRIWLRQSAPIRGCSASPRSGAYAACSWGQMAARV